MKHDKLSDKFTLKKILKRACWWFIGVFAYLCYRLAFRYPQWTENIYSRKIYPLLTKVFSFFTAHFSVSLSELLLYGILIGLIISIVCLIRACFRRGRLYHIISSIISLVTAACIAYGIFVFAWGFNYARQPLATSMGLDARPSEVQELVSLCETLSARANALRDTVQEDENGVFCLSKEKEYYLTHVQELYDAYADDVMNLGGETRVKIVFTPDALSHTQTMGIFSPFTYECHLNGQMPDLYVPSTIAHEYAHFKGFAREDEANFTAWYVTYRSPDADDAYSGTVLALLYAMNSLYSTDRDAHAALYQNLHPGILRDWQDDSAYWQPFQTDFAEQSNKVYNNYLKSNGVSDGSRSYGRMVDLLLAMQRENLIV